MPQVFDVIVLTTFDEEQKISFQYFIDKFRSRSVENEQKYKNVEFFIYVDVDIGVKLGSGGAVLFGLHYLEEKFGARLYDKRILFIPVGGFSTRQPNGSILGKVFTLAPLSPNRDTTYFEMKLNSCEKMLPILPCGVLVTASDVLEYHEDSLTDFHSKEDIFNKTGFTMVAYKSTVKVALNHGVYVFDRLCDDDDDDQKIFALYAKHNIRKVLQKPSLDELEVERACYGNDRRSSIEPGQLLAPQSDWKNYYSFVDGMFFMATDVVKTLIKFIRDEHFTIDAEICAYGDFLRPLGRDNVPDYARSSSTRTKLFHVLRPLDARCLWFRDSQFYHLGTLPELITHFCQPDVSSFARNCGVASPPLSCVLFNQRRQNQSVDINNVDSPGFKRNGPDTTNSHDNIRGCIMSSVVTRDSIVPKNCLVERCYFPEGVDILTKENESVLLSCCSSNERLVIHRPLFMTTVPVYGTMKETTNNRRTVFVTVIFEFGIDLKSRYENLESFTYFGRPITCVVDFWSKWYFERTGTHFWSDERHLLKGENQLLRKALFGQEETLWHARIFPGFPTMDESLRYTHQCVEFLTRTKITEKGADSSDNRVNGQQPPDNGAEMPPAKFERLYSMHDVFTTKDVPEMLRFCSRLTDLINAK